MANAIAKCQIFVWRYEPNAAQPNPAVATACQNHDRITYSRPPPHTMCPTAFLAPTLTAKTCFICTQPQNAFFLAQLALQGNRANGKKSLPGRVPGPKKGTKMVPNSGSFQEEFFLLSGQKKSQKLDRPALAWTWSAEKGSSSGKRYREMPNLRLKVRTQRRPAQCSSGDRLPERRSYHVLWGALDLRVTKLYF